MALPEIPKLAKDAIVAPRCPFVMGSPEKEMISMCDDKTFDRIADALERIANSMESKEVNVSFDGKTLARTIRGFEEEKRRVGSVMNGNIT